MIPVVSRRGPIVLAHRGGGAEAPENTMAAFEHARSLGVRHIETDAHLTADGRVVLSHDDTVDRCFDGTGPIAQLDWKEISRLRHRGAPGEKMPLLAEVLEAFPDMYFNIDAKAPGVVEPLIEVIEEHRAASRTLVASFKESRLRAVRTRGSIPTSLGTEAVVRLVGAAKTATDPSRWCVPGPSQGVVAAQVPAGLGPLRVVDRRFVATAHTLGLAVHVWTIDTAEEVLELLDCGIDGIVTERPTMVRDLLDSRGLWEAPQAPA